MFKILKPNGNIFDIAANEFSKYTYEITGKIPEIITEDDNVSDLVILGTDANNIFIHKLIINGDFKGFDIKYGTDDFKIKSLKIRGRNFLILGGGRERSLLYAVYSYFEKACNCRWFWDKDIIPKMNNLPLCDIDITEKPKMLYRGIRYFAHRGLNRFQAEMWGEKEWKKEIDWILKKKLNLFMLRIGNDDLFQKAFPDIVSYPADDTRENKSGFYDRTTAWPLKYRGELRKKILDYAFQRDLMHPEDFGTTTHWYTPTPQEFLDKVKPTFFKNISEGYNDNDLLVWDIREEKNIDNYLKLTKTHVKEYGRGELFHTIGFAERLYSEDRELNLKMKSFMYRKTMTKLLEKYPQAKFLIASWDLTGYYTPPEVKNLIKEFNPENTIIFDYTSDTQYNNNFTKWDVTGKFPYVFGIFQAYCSQNGALGRYDIIEKRLKLIKGDPYCKGIIFWPELAHSDSFMIEYFTKVSWNIKDNSVKKHISLFCKDRYGDCHSVINNIYDLFMDFIPLLTWDYHPTELFFVPSLIVKWLSEKDKKVFGIEYRGKNDIVNLTENALKIIDIIDKVNMDNELIRRDIFDILKVICGRFLQAALVEITRNILNSDKSEENLNMIDRCIDLEISLMKLLEGHEDYSLLSSYEKLFKEGVKVNSEFERTLKENASCDYNRTYVFEHFKMLYIPELKALKKWLKNSFKSNDFSNTFEYFKETEKIKEIYFNTPLKEMGKKDSFNKNLFNEIKEKIFNLF